MAKKTLQTNLTPEEKDTFIAACSWNGKKSASAALREYVIKVNRKYNKEVK